MFIKRVSALFLTIIYTDLNSNVNPEKESISFDVKNVELYKKRIHILEISVREMGNISKQNFNMQQQVFSGKNCQFESVS